MMIAVRKLHVGLQNETPEAEYFASNENDLR